ncbi:MAG: T9SS type A sorting domain-containing protein, partial [Flavobacteriales bacterium]|nr:T9SS type A sorting domain-containing protein [Flavobacteriales bacterium]
YYQGNGDGTFQGAVEIYAGSPTEIETADANNDGHADIIYANNSPYPVIVRPGNGDGTFGDSIASEITGFSSNYNQQIALGDFNDDGDIDVVVNEANADKVHVMHGNGDGSFMWMNAVTTLDQPFDLATGYFNADNKADVVCGYYYTTSSISVMLASGTGMLLAPTTVSLPNSFYFKLETEDFNEDGETDIAVTGLVELHILTGNGNGTFDAPLNSGISSYAEDLISGDFDGDDNIDLAWANDTGGSIGVRTGNGNATFDASSFSSSHGQPWDLVSGNFDGDDVPDIIGINYHNDQISFLKGNGDGTFGSQELATASTVVSVASGDANNDGNMDLAAANNGGSLDYMQGNGDGTFDATLTLIPGISFQDVALVDVNNDGDDDLVGMLTSTFVYVWISNGNGTFQTEIAYNAGSGAGGHRQLEVKDLNGDDYADIAGLYMQDDQFGVLLNNGSGGFLAEVLYNTEATPYDVHATDFDNDGDNDILTTAYDNNAVNYFSNNGNGTFAPLVSIPAGTTPVSVTSGDWNNDGLTDAACVNSNSVDITLYIQDGVGLPTITTIPIGPNTSPMEIVTADINGDGNDDLLVALNQTDEIGVFFGNGDGTFDAMISYTVEQSPTDVAIADFNNDGAIDMSSSNNGSQNLSVLLNNSIFFEVVGSTALCEGETVNLQVITQGSEQFTFEWSNGATSSSIEVGVEGDYYVAVTNQSGNCTLISPVVPVTVQPSDIDVTLSFDFMDPVCSGDDSFPLEGGAPQGGTWSGVGVDNGTFDPDMVGSGTFQITYTYVDPGGCATGSAIDFLTVNALPDVSIDLPEDVICIENGDYTLEGGLPAGGEFFGEFIDNGVFDPVSSGEGTFDIHYTYTDDNGCTGESEEQLVVDLCFNIGESPLSDILVYPTLVNDFISIKGTGTYLLTIIDTQGRLMQSQTITLPTTIDVNHFSCGEYFVRLISDEGICTKKIVVNNEVK